MNIGSAMNLFTWNPDEDKEEAPSPGTWHRCTPETLLAYCLKIQETEKRLPLLSELKKRFGGILGALVCAWELQRRGVLVGGKVIRR